MKSVRKISFFGNESKSAVRAALAKLPSLASRCGFMVTESADADIIVTLGGDGTILRAVHAFPGKTLLGLNLGGLGFLASVEERDYSTALALLSEGRYRLSRRTMLSVSGADGRSFLALNDVVLRRTAGHAAVLDLSVDGGAATRYHADGIVIASPTGSTAYSLSAGGPVLMPDSRSFVITPVCPHSLGVRSLVVRDDCVAALSNPLRQDAIMQPVMVCADGEEKLVLEPGGCVRVGRAAEDACFIEPEGCDPYEVLSRKLGWRGSNLNERGVK